MSIAILGGGILGVCTALELADRGHRVVLFERNPELLGEASLYNEGKLHLGFVYAADPSFRTAERMIQGASRFADILQRWLPVSAFDSLPSSSFDYVVHRNSMLTVPTIEDHFERVSAALVESMPSNRSPLPLDQSRPHWRRLSSEELSCRYNPVEVNAAYETCELSVDPWLIGQHLREVAKAQSAIELVTGARVFDVRDRTEGNYDIHFEQDGVRRRRVFKGVVNALWANRPAIDQKYGVQDRGPWFTRRKLGVNLQANGSGADIPSFTVMLGPFGDVVRYQSGRVYLSWYPVCMIGTTTGTEETDWTAVLRTVDRAHVRRATIDALAELCPAVRTLTSVDTENYVVNGGSIFALGKSDIVDPKSQLHERFNFGVNSRGTYLSVDTAKFTLGPLMALETAERMSAVISRRS